MPLKEPLDIMRRVTSGGPEFESGFKTAPPTLFASYALGPGGLLDTVGPIVVAGTVGVGQMKVDAPPCYLGGHCLGAWVWLTRMEHYMCLMRFNPMSWLDIVAMRVDGNANLWINATLAGIECGQRLSFSD